MTSWRVAGDWGTSRLRLFRIIDGRVVDRIDGPGISALDRSPEAALREAIAAWRARGDPDQVVLCGMVGSRNGWVEVPYVEAPVDVRTWRAGAATVALDGIPVMLLPGVAGQSPLGAPEVMRGEETQLFGALASGALHDRPTRVALPGTHSKWVSLADGCIGAFQTFLTGELFALLRDWSTLTRAAGADALPSDVADEEAGFAHGLARAREGVLIGALFEARAAQLRLGRPPAWSLGYLSGLLIGREVAEATAGLCRGQPLAVIGDLHLCDRYRRALAAVGHEAALLDGDTCVLAGLTLMETA